MGRVGKRKHVVRSYFPHEVVGRRDLLESIGVVRRSGVEGFHRTTERCVDVDVVNDLVQVVKPCQQHVSYLYQCTSVYTLELPAGSGGILTVVGVLVLEVAPTSPLH